MRNVMAAIGRMLAAMAAVVMVWCERTLQFVLRISPFYAPPDPAAVVDQYDSAAHAVDVTPKADELIIKLQSAADYMFRQQDVTAEMIEGLSPKALGWLAVLDADMLLSVTKAKQSELAEHLALRKQIPGLIRYESDAIEAYTQAVEADLKVPKRPDRAPDRIYPTAWHLPAFGPIC